MKTNLRNRIGFFVSTLVLVSGLTVALNVGAEPPKELRSIYTPPTTVPFPDYNPYTPEKVLLGKTLFFDPRLSGGNDIACATCHNPGFGWEDGRPLPVGAAGQRQHRHTPTLLNQAWGERFGWDGRQPTLEAFVLGPIANENEMNQNLDALVVELNQVTGYQKLFAAAFSEQTISIDHISLAIATFMRTIRSGETLFDRWIAGDENAMPLSARAGFFLFTGRAGCSQCHTGWNFTDAKFHDTGLDTTDLGRGGLANAKPVIAHTFKTPTLRDIEKRAPYMHNGSIETLAQVIQHYSDGFQQRPSLAPEIKSLSLSRQEALHIEAFLRMLSSNKQRVSFPDIPE